MQTTQSEQPSQVFQNSVVVFSKNYMPLARINLKRAIVLIATGQAASLDFSNAQQWEVRSPSIVLQVSEHIRLIDGNPERHWKVPPVSRREVLYRDKHTGDRTKCTLFAEKISKTWITPLTVCSIFVV